jgi:D-alanyl-D-alanine carboxypeptidase
VRRIRKSYTINAKQKRSVQALLFIIIMVMACILMSSTFFTIDASDYENRVNASSKAVDGGTFNATGSSSITAPVTSPEQTAQSDVLTLGSMTQLVNKTHGVPQDYEPADLVAVPLDGIRQIYLRKEASDAMVSLFNGAAAAGLTLKCCSGYRSYDTQVSVFDSEAASNGLSQTEATTAPPGYSEHQTGLCADITSDSAGLNLSEDFANTPEGQWLAANAHLYGYIIRYPKGMEGITGYTFEPWHIRYLGVDLATAVYNSGKTYEEYVNILN